MPEVLQGADVYCSMSRSDGTSLSLLEAMACGLAPVVSDIPANREWIDDGVDGVLVAPGEVETLASALTRVALDEDFRRSASARVREKVVERGDQRTNMARILAAVEKVARGA
jgi:glycosyltransferase involved in cell wall biosynthesis